jgi:hypothetical protein
MGNASSHGWPYELEVLEIKTHTSSEKALQIMPSLVQARTAKK